MVLGKSLTLAFLISTSAVAESVWEPRFFEYRSNSSLTSRIIDLSFGWNKKLNNEQKAAYYQSIIHAAEYAENGEKVKWYKQNASGYSVPVMTWPKGDGYCRRLHLEAIAFGKRKTMVLTGCYNNIASNWHWYGQ
jgi:surface antigen